MWSCSLECHQKQLLATTETKTCNVTWKMATDAKATAQLEQEFLNWSLRFSKWIKTQRSYIKSILDWVEFLVNDKEVGKTAVGGVFLSNEAPCIFVLCKDWMKLMNGVSEDGVIASMNASAGTMHDLLEMQDLEKYPYKRRSRSMMMRWLGWMCSPTFNSKDLETSEAKEKHGEIVRQLNGEASRILRTCLIPILHALGCFIKNTSTSYEELGAGSLFQID